MNTKFLGDEIDHWKGSLILILTRLKLISNFAVDPMVTNCQRWSEENLQTYERLLYLERNMICHNGNPFLKGRQDYFAGIQHEGDLFLDPDTGISIGRRVLRKHITIPEICYLLNVNRKRVLMIYQHSARGNFRELLKKIIDNRLKYDEGVLYYCVYEGGRVAMFFISQNRKRIQAIQNGLHLYINDQGRRVWGNGHIA